MLRYTSDICKCSLDAISSLAKYLVNECDRAAAENKQLLDALQYFLNVSWNRDAYKSSQICFVSIIICQKFVRVDLTHFKCKLAVLVVAKFSVNRGGSSIAFVLGSLFIIDIIF